MNPADCSGRDTSVEQFEHVDRKLIYNELKAVDYMRHGKSPTIAGWMECK